MSMSFGSSTRAGNALDEEEGGDGREDREDERAGGEGRRGEDSIPEALLRLDARCRGRRCHLVGAPLWCRGVRVVRGGELGHNPSLPGAPISHNTRGTGQVVISAIYLMLSTAACAFSKSETEIGAVPAASADAAWPSSLMM
jgi:hypothetical protein